MRCANILTLALAASLAGGTLAAADDGVAWVDFSQKEAKLKPALQGSSWAIRLARWPGGVDDERLVTNLHTYAVRTHDGPCANEAISVGDVPYMFPLMHLDAKDPRNYSFVPTDAWLEKNVNAGINIYFRLGSSAESTGKWGYGTLNPKDHVKYAEVLAGIVRHYVRGWGPDGKRWGERMRYWELFNEPDWYGCFRGTMDEFADLFAVSLKRLKDEFPEIRVGGPAFAHPTPERVKKVAAACDAKGVKPDFVSWHYYGAEIAEIVAEPAAMRKMCDDVGWKGVELVNSEWHYLNNWYMYNPKYSPVKIWPGIVGAESMGGIDSGVFTLSAQLRFQESPLAQSYFYGLSYDGDFGMANRAYELNKTYYAAKFNGDLIAGYTDRVRGWADLKKGQTVLGAWSADGREAALVVCDYRGKAKSVEVEVRGLGAKQNAQALVLDDGRNPTPVPVRWNGDLLVLEKSAPGSAAFFVRFGSDKPFPPQVSAPRTFTFASWNIGHFSLGTRPKSTLPLAAAPAKGAAYRKFLSEVNADVIGVCEFSEAFATNGALSAKDEVFSNYPLSVVGPSHDYQWNAQFLRGATLQGTRTHEYTNHCQKVYYLESRVNVCGEDVVFVETHLDWEDPAVRATQMHDLVERFRNVPRVVIAGDFNEGVRYRDGKTPDADNPVEYKVFADAGFTLGNDGRFKTYPPEKPFKALDNIIVRGLKLRNFKVWMRGDLSDHALVSAELELD